MSDNALGRSDLPGLLAGIVLVNVVGVLPAALGGPVKRRQRLDLRFRPRPDREFDRLLAPVALDSHVHHVVRTHL